MLYKTEIHQEVLMTYISCFMFSSPPAVKTYSHLRPAAPAALCASVPDMASLVAHCTGCSAPSDRWICFWEAFPSGSPPQQSSYPEDPARERAVSKGLEPLGIKNKTQQNQLLSQNSYQILQKGPLINKTRKSLWYSSMNDQISFFNMCAHDVGLRNANAVECIWRRKDNFMDSLLP